jgi:hypothetical protein
VPPLRAEIYQSESTLGFLEIVCDRYDESLRQALLGITPRAFRRWSGGTRRWLVHRSKLEELKKILADLGIEVTIVQTSVPKVPRVRKDAGPYAVLHLLPSAPDQLVTSAYRIAALTHHPDKHGGDTKKMAAINQAYEQIRKERSHG